MNLKRKTLTVGVVLVALVIAGVAADFLSFDRTKGGYEPPYSYTGEPIDWTTVKTTPTGMRKPGYVLDVFVDCTSGMMHIGMFGIKILPFRKFSPRALVVHRPREACAKRGFSPKF